MGGGMMGDSLGGFGLAVGSIGLLFNIVIIVGIVVLIIWAMQKISRSSGIVSQTGSSNQSLSAREILDIRYARGDFSREEYQTKLSDILE